MIHLIQTLKPIRSRLVAHDVVKYCKWPVCVRKGCFSDFRGQEHVLVRDRCAVGPSTALRLHPSARAARRVPAGVNR